MNRQPAIGVASGPRWKPPLAWGRRALPAVVSATCLGLLAVVLWDRLPAVGRALGQANGVALGLALLLYLCALYLLAARLGVVFAVFGIRQSASRYLLYTLVGLFFNNFLPTGMGGDLVKASYAAGRTEEVLEAFLATFADRVIGVIGLVLAGTLALTVYPTVESGAWAMWVSLGSAGLLLALGLGCRSDRLVQVSLGWVQRVPLAERLRLPRLARAVLALLRAPGSLLRALSLTLLSVACSSLCLWVIARGMGLEVSYTVFLLVLPVVSLVTVVPSINGIGVREASMVVVLRGLVPEEQALALAVLFYGVAMACSILGGLVFVFRRPLGLQVNPSLTARFLRER